MWASWLKTSVEDSRARGTEKQKLEDCLSIPSSLQGLLCKYQFRLHTPVEKEWRYKCSSLYECNTDSTASASKRGKTAQHPFLYATQKLDQGTRPPCHRVQLQGGTPEVQQSFKPKLAE